MAAGRDDIAAWHLGPGACVPGFEAGRRWRSTDRRPSRAYKLSPEGSHLPFSVQVLDLDGDKIERITYFLDTSLFERFGLPPKL